MGHILGIDVSEHNGVLDWAKIKASGIKFAIIRTGYGTSHVDKQFINNVKGAIANNIPFGVYHFSYALNEYGATNEAAFVATVLDPYKDKITLPVFFDFEYDTIEYAAKQGVTLGRDAFNAHTVAFCEAIKKCGHTPGTYYNLDYKRRFVDDSMLGNYVQWYAQYAPKATWTGYDIWQYSSSHRIDGINSRFDINIADESILTVATGWKKDDKGWWYRDADGGYPRECWRQIEGKWYYFDQDGYMLSDTEFTYAGKVYVIDENGHIVNIRDKEDTMGKTFGDVNDSAWYAEAVDYCKKQGLMQGISDGKFEPEKTVTRAELAQALANLHQSLT